MVALGVPRLKWLNAFRKSARSCSRKRSRARKFLEAEMSQFQEPGPNSMLREELPHVHGCGAANAAALNHGTPLTTSWPLPLLYRLDPETRSARLVTPSGDHQLLA